MDNKRDDGDLEHLIRMRRRKFADHSIAENMMMLRENNPNFAQYIFGMMRGGCGIVSIETITTDIYTDIVQFSDGSQLAIIEGKMRWVQVEEIDEKSLEILRQRRRTIQAV